MTLQSSNKIYVLLFKNINACKLAAVQFSCSLWMSEQTLKVSSDRKQSEVLPCVICTDMSNGCTNRVCGIMSLYVFCSSTV